MAEPNTKLQMTQSGLEELTAELNKLKSKEPQAIDRVTKAREFGDLSETSAYYASREVLAFIQGRIEEIDEMILRVQVVASNGHKDKVDIGSEVTIHAEGVDHTYTVVGEYEADPLKKKISHDSPLGKALMGKKAGDTVEYEAPVGKVTYTVKKIN